MCGWRPAGGSPLHCDRALHKLQESDRHTRVELRGPFPPVQRLRDHLPPGRQPLSGRRGLRRSGRRVLLRQPRLQLPV